MPGITGSEDDDLPTHHGRLVRVAAVQTTSFRRAKDAMRMFFIIGSRAEVLSRITPRPRQVMAPCGKAIEAGEEIRNRKCRIYGDSGAAS